MRFFMKDVFLSLKVTYGFIAKTVRHGGAAQGVAEGPSVAR